VSEEVVVEVSITAKHILALLAIVAVAASMWLAWMNLPRIKRILFYRPPVRVELAGTYRLGDEVEMRICVLSELNTTVLSIRVYDSKGELVFIDKLLNIEVGECRLSTFKLLEDMRTGEYKVEVWSPRKLIAEKKFTVNP